MNDPTALPAPAMALLAAAELQDNLLKAASDLARLQSLIDHSHETLQLAFFGTLQLLEGETAGRIDANALGRAREQLVGAVKALQFQDMATQLITHTSCCLHNCANRLAQDTFADDEDGQGVIEEAPLRLNPVSQGLMDTGFVELF